MSDEANYARKSVTSSSTRMPNSKKEVLVNFYNTKMQDQQQQVIKDQIKNIEMIQKLNIEDQELSQKQKHMQQIQKITSKAISQRNGQNSLQLNQNQVNAIQHFPLSATNQSSQKFQFFAPQKADEILNNEISRNSQKNIQKYIKQNNRQCVTSYKQSRTKNQSSHDIRSQQLIGDDEDEKQSVITGNNQIISSSIQRVKNSASGKSSPQFQINPINTNLPYQQNQNNESHSAGSTPIQAKFRGNQFLLSNYAVGNFTPTKDDLTKRQLYQFQNGAKYIKQKMNISQFLQNTNSSQIQIQSNSNQSMVSINRTNNVNHSALINNIYSKNDQRVNSSMQNNQNKEQEYRRLNKSKNNDRQTELNFVQKLESANQNKRKSLTKHNPPNINEFIEREILAKKQQQNITKESNKSEKQQQKSPIPTQQSDEKPRLKFVALNPNQLYLNLNEQEREQLEKLESGGFISYINSTFIDCEYMYKEQIQKQLIQLQTLFDNKDQFQINIQSDADTQTQDYNKIKRENIRQVLKITELKDVKKQVEKLLCIEVAKKKERKASDLEFAVQQMQSFEEILREGLKRCSEQFNVEIKNLILELVSSLLLLQNKKHILVEKRKRDDMILFLGGLKDKEKEFNVNIFGPEAEVQAFRFKIGEIELENQQLQKQIQSLTGKYNQLSQTHQKQRKLSTMIKNEYLNIRNVNTNLNERLNQKFESYEKRMSRASLDPHALQQFLLKNNPGNFQMMESPQHTSNMSQNRQFDSSRQSQHMNVMNIDNNLLNVGFQASKPFDFTPQTSPVNTNTNIMLQVPSTSIQVQTPNAKGGSQILNENLIKHEESQNANSNINDDEDEEECDIEDILREAQKITKVENHEVLIREVTEKIPTLYYNKDCQTDPKITNPKNTSASLAIQTDLQLLDSQFDHIMDNERLKQVSKQEEIKEQLLNISEPSDIESEGNKSLVSTDEPSNSKAIFQRLKNRITIVRLLRGLPMKQRKKQIKKKEIEQFSENIKVLKNFLESSPSQSEESIGSADESDQDEYDEDGGGGGNQTNNNSKIIRKPFDDGIQTPGTKSLKKQRQSKFIAISHQGTPSNFKDAAGTPAQRKLQHFSTQGSTFGKTPVSMKNRQSTLNIDTQLSQFAKQPQIEEDQTPHQSQFAPNQNDSSKISIKKKKNVKETNQIIHDNKDDLKEQILSIVKLYNLETEKCNNYEESIKQLLDIMQELFNFTYKIFSHVQKTQRDSYKSVVEQFFQQFTSLRWKMPKEIDQKLEEDLFPQEALKKKLLQKKNRQIKSQSNAPRAAAQLFNNGKMFQKLTVQDKSVHSGVVLTKKVREVGLPKRFNGYLPLKSILRQITQIYEDRIRQIKESRLAPDTEMCIFIFNKFIHQYGFKNVAEQKYLHFLMNILNYQQIFRVNIFARLVGVFQHDEDNYSIEEMDKYISCWHFLVSGSTMGSAIPFNESDLRIYTHYLRALDLFKVKLEKILPADYINELRAFVEQNKEFEQKQTNKLVVDVDQLLSRVIMKYRLTMNSTKVYVRNAFLACDLDGNGSINLNEFLTLYRHIEVDKFSFSKAFKMFESHADIITEDEKCLSFQKFTALCLQNQLFLDAAQRRFIGVRESYEIEQQFLELRGDWSNEKLILNNYIDSLKPFVQIETYEVWRDVLLVLQDRILKNQKVQSKEAISNVPSRPGSSKKVGSAEDIQNNNANKDLKNEYQYNVMPILIAHKLLKLELKRLVEVGQNEENLEADLNSDSGDDDLNNDYAVEENPNNDDNEDVQDNKSLNHGTPSLRKGNYSMDHNMETSQHLTTEKGAPKIDLVDAQIYQFSDLTVVRETPSNSSKRKNNQMQSSNGFSQKSPTFSQYRNN